MESDLMLDGKNVMMMKLLHYFITEKNYNPIILQGVENEIWLENLNEDYKVIRIVSNHIHNDEQFAFDVFKTKRIVKKIKRKTLSLNMNVLSIFLDLGEKTKNFCFTLLDNKKMDHINSIHTELTKMINAEKNIQEAIVVSAVQLNRSEIAKIKAKLENKFKKEFNLTNTINEDIISGLMIRIEDTLIDLSLRTKLNSLKKQII